MSEKKVIYYEDELNDEFSTMKITPIPIDEHYDYGGKSFFWHFRRFLFYRLFAMPLAFLYLKLKYRHKIINRAVLKPWQKGAFFIYGNHTNILSDPLVPTFVSFPKSVFVVVHPNNVSIPHIGQKMRLLGALPLPDNFAAAKNFMRTMEMRIKSKCSICIYPEAHIWPFYTKIRPFPDTSFKYPVQYKVPAFCFTNVYQKRHFSKNPRMITYVDGPFFADASLSAKEQRKALRDAVYEKMCQRSVLNNVELIKYIKKTDSQTGENGENHD
ncbi:1-acyl-sn-glycerol-3-phosphate acyltransferase [Treponema sp.]|uniref:lysophospholipid acyltransferase family protein n=1 Tax=Treponema sp. TaxID=166 RepID=UPI0025DD26D9|nr:1-acyl-sn-glycerol-3-phosphate acyltransferase [Treponema sp.]MBR4323304.1 hypothetical protein [Treponema sp.]